MALSLAFCFSLGGKGSYMTPPFSSPLHQVSLQPDPTSECLLWPVPPLYPMPLPPGSTAGHFTAFLPSRLWSWRISQLWCFPSYGVSQLAHLPVSATSSILLKQRFQRIMGPPDTAGKSEVQWSNQCEMYHLSYLLPGTSHQQIKGPKSLTLKTPA